MQFSKFSDHNNSNILKASVSYILNTNIFSRLLAECQQYWSFQLWVTTHCVNSAASLSVVTSSAIKQCRYFNNLIMILCFQPPKRDFGTHGFLWILGTFSACNFIKNGTLVQVLSWKFWENFHPATLLKARPRHRSFSVTFVKFLRASILQKICKGLLLIMWLLVDSFINFIV